jgi:pyrroloquinoline quinone (PQQ) biosynthesis protein C
MKQEHIEIQKLNDSIEKMWEQIFSSEMAQQFISSFMGKDKRIYALYLTQVYYYAYYTPRNLAIAGANLNTTDTNFMHHCFEHAMEETGHELMALNDLRMLGLTIEKLPEDMPRILPSTETMIGYVKFLATSSNPYRIMGYSYWIERPYRHILKFMEQMEVAMGLNKNQMTFYYNHKEIDKKHGQDIENAIISLCATQNYWDGIREATLTTMQLMLNLLLEIIKEYNKLDSKESAYSMLNLIR